MKRLILPIFLSPLLAIGAAAPDAADAAQRRDAAALAKLAQQKADLNAAQTDGTTALHWAAHWADLAMVNTLLKAGANPNSANRFGATPLSEAVELGNTAIVDALLNAGADGKAAITKDGETPLMTAARGGHLDIVKLLVAKGADVNARESYRGQTALMWASAEHHADVVKFLLDKGADWKPRSVERDSKMPKLSAASSVTPMARGGFAALHFAAREGDADSARYLLDAGADINQGDADNSVALTIALMNKQYTFAKFLLDRGANPNIADAFGRTPLYAAIDIRNEDYSALPSRQGIDPMPSIDIVKALLDKGANPDMALSKPLPGRSGMDSGDTSLGVGTTPMMRAARAGDTAVMRALLAKGADPKKTTQTGNNILLYAAGVGYRDKNTHGTEAEALEAVKLALELGLDINQKNGRGETPIHGAAGRGADTIAAYLASKGAAIDSKTGGQNPLTPMDYAMGKNVLGQLPVPHDSTVELFKKLGAHEAKDVK